MSEITLALDPSLRAFGWAVIASGDILDGGCITSKTTDKDPDVLKNIATVLKETLEKYKCTQIVFESSVGSKSSRANQALSYTKGLVISCCVFYGCKYQYITARNVKKALTLDKDASKAEILKKVSEKLQSFDNLVADLPKFKVYAVSDAAAVFLGLEI